MEWPDFQLRDNFTGVNQTRLEHLEFCKINSIFQQKNAKRIFFYLMYLIELLKIIFNDGYKMVNLQLRA